MIGKLIRRRNGTGHSRQRKRAYMNEFERRWLRSGAGRLEWLQWE